MSAAYVRRCPTCGAENAPSVMRCACGALLAGVDLVSRHAEPATAPAPPQPNSAADPEAPTLCAYDDCAQPNPPGSQNCLYCNRPLRHPAALSSASHLPSLISLPGTLRERYRILHPLPAPGAQAELLLVQAHDGGPELVAKIYRHGLQPRPEVQQRIARIDRRFCVAVLEAGNAEGYAYEVMEFCAHGSLRELLRQGPLPAELLQAVLREIADALAAVHAVGLLHRDLKPENTLVRSLRPLDLVLTDFGISSVLDATQRFTGTARTLPYASPESLSGVIDGKADYWALGIIMLEASQGRHPFAELSEAVILHHLTTRSIDLDGVADRTLRKLLRGLLLRDPQQRWGQHEIARWLAGDSSLAEPTEQGLAQRFAEPYHLAKDLCHSKEQLAVALARNWSEGCADINNGLLLNWFRDVQKDQNAVRLLIELRTESSLPADLQLLKLMLHLAPGIPPVWRGESIELRAILSRANAALKGDAAAEKWLDTLHRLRVLEAYANAGNADCAELVRHWSRACDDFVQAWAGSLALLKNKAPGRSPDEYANFDQLVYGKSEPDRPSLATMHARLLALAYDTQWSERLRQRLTAELASLMVHCPWLGELGDPRSLEPAALLVLEGLLPQAREVADRQIKADARQRQQLDRDCAALGAELRIALVAVREAATSSLILPTAASDLRASLDRYDEVIARIKASGSGDAAWLELRKTASRTKPVVNRLGPLLDTLTERRAVDAGWLSLPVLGFVTLALLLLPALWGPRAFYALLLAAAGVLAWRLLPSYQLMREIRGLGEKL